jgi:hypothetical protein
MSALSAINPFYTDRFLAIFVSPTVYSLLKSRWPADGSA